jgi:hypothetical protein
MMMATTRPIVLFFFFVLVLTLAHGHRWIGRPVVFSPHDKRPRGTFLPRFTISHPRMRLRGGQDEVTDNAVLEPTTAAAAQEEGVSPNLNTNTTALEDEEETDLLEQEEAMEEFQVDSEDEEEAYYHSDSDIENDVALELLDSEDYELDEAEEVENEDEAIDVVLETVVDLSKRTSILALKASKVTAIWVRQWSLDFYRACQRAIEAGRLELEEGDDDWLIAELSEEEEESRFQAARKKALRLSKRCFKTMTQMTIAFWTMDDDDILLDEETEENVFKLPSISFFSKFKLHKEYQEDTQNNNVQEEEEETVAGKVRAKCVGGDDSSPTKRRRHRRRSSRNDKTPTTTDADMTSDTTTVTVIPKIAKGRKLWTNVAVGIASIVLWQQVGGQALLAKGMHMVQHHLQTRSDKGSLQPDKNKSNT